MHILPLELILILWLAFCLLMSQADNTENILIFRDIKNTAHNFLCVCSVRKSTLMNLAPATAKSEFFCLEKHTVSCNRTIFYPAVVLQSIATDNDSKLTSLQELATHSLGVSKFLKVELTFYDNKLPRALALR